MTWIHQKEMPLLEWRALVRPPDPCECWKVWIFFKKPDHIWWMDHWSTALTCGDNLHQDAFDVLKIDTCPACILLRWLSVFKVKHVWLILFFSRHVCGKRRRENSITDWAAYFSHLAFLPSQFENLDFVFHRATRIFSHEYSCFYSSCYNSYQGLIAKS